MARSSSGLGRLVLNQQITGSNPVRATFGDFPEAIVWEPGAEKRE